MDADGYVWYEGRADDVIISAGYRIGPFEVESACLEHRPSRGRRGRGPGRARGNIVKAFIVLAAGHEGTDELAEEHQGVRARPALGLRVSAAVEFVDELPKTLTGKIRRIELRDQARSRADATDKRTS